MTPTTELLELCREMKARIEHWMNEPPPDPQPGTAWTARDGKIDGEIVEVETDIASDLYRSSEANTCLLCIRAEGLAASLGYSHPPIQFVAQVFEDGVRSRVLFCDFPLEHSVGEYSVAGETINAESFARLEEHSFISSDSRYGYWCNRSDWKPVVSSLSTWIRGLETNTVMHSRDFSSVNWFGTLYTFTPIQASCIKVLYQEWQNNTPVVGEAAILESAETSSPLRNIFQGHAAWKSMIVSPMKGRYRLQDPEPI